jgi:hypothetical protein
MNMTNDASIMIIDDSRVMFEILASLTDNSRGVIFDTFMILWYFARKYVGR